MSKIPQKKHSDKELSDLRARSAMQSANSPIVAVYNKKLAHKATVVLGYALPLTSPVWAMVKQITKDSEYVMSDLYIMLIPIILGLLVALWIALKRVLSRHNAAFIFIIALFCCFPIVHAVSSDKILKNKVLSLIGMEPETDESDFSSDAGSGTDNLSGDEIREMLQKEKERIERENRERILEADEDLEIPAE